MPQVQVNTDFSDLSEALNQPYFKLLREQDLTGVENPGCRHCDSAERLGNHSIRKYANGSYSVPPHPSSSIKIPEIEYLEVFVGTQCNLKCVMCGPDVSSAWVSDYRALGWNFDSSDSKIEDGDLMELAKQLPNLKNIKFVGGEPFLSKSHWDLVRSLAADRAGSMKLNYYTNATIWPNPKQMALLDDFEQVHLCLSIDGVGVLNDYIRFPSQWSVVESHVHKFFDHASKRLNFKISLNCTVSALNIFNVDEVERWFTKLRSQYPARCFDFLFLNPLKKPEYLAINNLPEALKKIARDRLDKGSWNQLNLARILEQPLEPARFSELASYIQSLERIRGNKIGSAVPEMAALLS